jgi:CelD/BcsL family acetyltransferase involved in cellulose biosynthesis
MTNSHCLGITIRMDIECYQDINQLLKIKEEWNSLASQNPLPSVFLTFEWFESFLKAFGKDKEFMILIARENTQVVGIFPLGQNSQSHTIELIGKDEVSDYRDILIKSPLELKVLKCFFEFLKDYQWEKLQFKAVPPNSWILTSLKELAKEQGFKVNILPYDVCPYLKLKSSWLDYLNTLKKKYRHEIRRKIKRLNCNYSPKIEVLSHKERLKRFIDLFFSFQKGTKKEAFFYPQMRYFFSELCKNMEKKGWLDFRILRLDEKEAAILLSFKFQNKVYAYNSGYNSSFSNISPGFMLFISAIKEAIQTNKIEFDFLRGNEPYKYHLGATPRKIYQVTIEK